MRELIFDSFQFVRNNWDRIIRPFRVFNGWHRKTRRGRKNFLPMAA